MQINLKNHNNGEVLKPTFVHENTEAPKGIVSQPEALKSRDELLKEKLKTAQETWGNKEKELKDLIAEYEEEYEMIPNLKSPTDVDIKINNLSKEEEALGKIRGHFYQKEARKELLQSIKKGMIDLELAKKTLEEAEKELKTYEEEATKRSAQTLVDRVTRIEALKSGKEKMEEGLYFEEFSKEVESKLGDLQLALLSNTPDQIPSAQERRMHYQNFMAILRNETNDFSTRLVLKNFTNNWEQNKKNYPQYYQEWLGERGKKLPQEINETTAEINRLSTSLGLSGIDITTIDAAIGKILEPSAGIGLNIPENRLSSIATSNDEIQLHTERSEAIYKMQKELEGSMQSETNPIKQAGYKTKINKLNEFIKLEDQITILKRQEKRFEENISQNFTREKLENDPAIRSKFIRLAFDQYKQAVEVVNAMGVLNPRVRLDVIATLYRQGVNRENARDAYWMLTQLLQSERYSALERGKYISEEQRNYLMIAYQSSNALHNWRLYEENTRTAAEAIRAVSNPGSILEIGSLKETKSIKDWQKTLETLTQDFAVEVKKLPEGRLYENDEAGRKKMLNIYLATIENDEIRNKLTETKKKIQVIEQALLEKALLDVKKESTLNTNGDYTSLLDFPVREGSSRDTAFMALAQNTNQGKDIINNRALTDLTAEEKQVLIEIGQKERVGALEAKYKALPIGNPMRVIMENLYIYELNRLSAPIWNVFIEQATKYLQNPETPEAQAFLRKVENGETLEGKGITKSEMEAHKKYLKDIETTYELMDFKEKSKNQHLELMGIRTETIYSNFVEYLQKNPDLDLRTDRWDTLLRDKKGTETLSALFNAILPEQMATDSMIGTKKDFLRVFGTLYTYDKPATTTYEGHEAQAAALTIYNLVKLEIEKREAAEYNSRLGANAQKEAMEGVTIADKIEKYSRGVIDMVIGPGQSLGNRIAGIAVLMFAWKAAKKAYKGEGKMGKGLQYLFMAGAAELTMKQITGRGILERVGLHPALRAFEGTYDEVLVDQGREFMKDSDITPEQHIAALYEMKNIPMGDLLKFYESTTENGMAREGMQDAFPNQIRISRILRGSVSGNKDTKTLEAKRVVRKTLQQFFEYVGNKEDKHHEAGFNMIKERYLKGLDPNFKLSEATDTEFAYNGFRDNPRMLTFDAVKTIEINTDDLKEGTGNKIIETAKEYYNRLRRFTTEEVMAPASVEAKEFFEAAGNKASDIKEWLANMSEKAATGLYFEKEKVVYWYEGKKHTIRRFAADHWELLVEGVKLPAEILIGADKLIVPWATTKLRQTREIFRIDKLHIINHTPSRLDIMTSPAYFGVFTEPFAKALESKGQYYETTNVNEEGDVGIGYYVSKKTAEDPGVRGIQDEGQKLNALQIQSYEDAKNFFVNMKHVSPELVDKYMYPIHVMTRNATGSTPETMYTFWRMPLPSSGEFVMKEQGRWADYMDPNEHKLRPPFILDPNASLYENIMKAYGLRLKGPREAYSWAGSNVAAQAMRIYIATVENIGGAIASTINLLPKVSDADVKWIREISTWSESKKRTIDEVLTSAKDPSLAISDFYKKEANAKIYKEKYESALNTQSALDLEKWPARDSAIKSGK